MPSAADLYRYIEGNDPNPLGDAPTYEDLRDSYVRTFKQQVPEWTSSTGSPLYKAFENIAYRQTQLIEYVRDWMKQRTFKHMSGAMLDDFVASRAGVIREGGETDAALKLRYLEEVESLPSGTEEAYEALLRLLDPDSSDVDVDVTVSNLGYDLSFYLLGPGGIALTPAQRTAVEQEIDKLARKKIHFGDTYSVDATTATDYTISATYKYDSRDNSLDQISGPIREAAYKFIDEKAKIGEGFTLYQLRQALGVPGVLDVVLAQPTADVPGAAGAVPTCPKTDTAVVLTPSDVAP